MHLTSSNEVKSGGTHTPPFLQGHLSISGKHGMTSEVKSYTVCVCVCVCVSVCVCVCVFCVSMCMCVCTCCKDKC